MQAKTKTEPYDYFEPIFDGNFEVPLDTDYNLPDYCADVQRILKCRAVPEISSYVVGNESITCDGICDIRIMYLDSRGEGIKCCDFAKPFSATIPSKSTSERAVACVRPTVQHMTCRAVSARKVDLHITLGLNVLAVVQKKDFITVEVNDENIEKRTQTLNASKAVNAVGHQFTFEDFVPLKSGKPPIENILRRDIAVRLMDVEAKDDRLNVSGAVDLSFLYNSFVDGVTAEKMTASIDFDQMIDCTGADENCICDVNIICGESSIQPKEDTVGENTGVDVFARLFVVGFVYKPYEVDVIDDAYSVNRPAELHYAQNNFMQIYGTNEETLKNKCLLTVSGEEIQKIIDIWTEAAETNSYCDKGKMNHRVKYNICMLYANTQDRIMYTEKGFDFNHNSDLSDERIKKSDSKSRTEIWEYRILDKSTVEVAVETAVNSLLYSRFASKQLVSAEIDEEAELPAADSKLLVYYAYEGEELWDIAKEHRALISDIRAQNNISDEKVNKSGPIIICNR
ncbi:DUF3794 domain-containing protein [Scatolibacter rhodanostii]|uniref:DUF3794 domain-containing protein n=1 Tax=Scatolibacter rhodanostii TaxID=2014781 RepID=UPI000C06DAE8|nr:DUF3794 domain-containing protein [Scatolibacter rhodanostii]